MSEVVDLNQARLEKVIKDSGAPVLGAPVPEGGLVVSVLACSNCGSTAFSLGHHDPMTGKALNIVICAVCRNQIVSLRWRDVNLEPEPAA